MTMEDEIMISEYFTVTQYHALLRNKQLSGNYSVLRGVRDSESVYSTVYPSISGMATREHHL